MNQQSSLLKGISTLLLFIVCVLYLQGLRGIGTIGLVLFVLWLAFTVLAYGKKLASIFSQRRFILLFLFLFFYFFSSLFSVGLSSSFNRIVAIANLLSPILMYEIMKNKKRSTRVCFIVIISFVLLYDVFLSFRFQETYGIDDMRRGVEMGGDYHLMAIAFDICYAIALIIPAVVELIKKTKYSPQRRYVTLLLLLSIIILFVFLIRAQFTIAIIIVFLGVAYAFFYDRKHVFRFVLVSGILVFLFISILPLIIDIMGQGGEHQEIAKRFEEINYFTEGNRQNAGDINSRQNLSFISIETFFKHPVFGVNHKIDPNIHVGQQGIGNHSEWFDSLARYGLFAFLLMYFLFDSLRRQRQETDSGLVMFLFIILGFLNPVIYYPQMVTTFLYLPIMYQLFIERG